MLDIQTFLRKIAPYVVVVGSFGRQEETRASDIDCFLRSRPRAEVDVEIQNDTYMPEILDVLKEQTIFWDSVIIGHIAIERQPGFPRMVEVSSLYIIPCSAHLFYREICGVKMLCASADGKQYRKAETYDEIAWDEALCDTVVKNPLPAYTPE